MSVEQYQRSVNSLDKDIAALEKDFVWQGSKTDVEQMIGNAVPVNLAAFVATCLLEVIKENCKNV